MKLPKKFSTRAAAEEAAVTLRQKYVSVVVYPIGGKFGARNHPGPFGVSYDPQHLRINPRKRK